MIRVRETSRRLTQTTKNSVKEGMRRTWRVVTFPTSVSLDVAETLLDHATEQHDSADQRKIVAIFLSEFHDLLEQHESVAKREVGNVTEYVANFSEATTVKAYFRQRTHGYVVHIDKIERDQYGKPIQTMFGPIFLAKQIGDIRPFQNRELFLSARTFSRYELVDLMELLTEVFIQLAPPEQFGE